MVASNTKISQKMKKLSIEKHITKWVKINGLI